jgi:hypothetical protein
MKRRIRAPPAHIAGFFLIVSGSIHRFRIICLVDWVARTDASHLAHRIRRCRVFAPYLVGKKGMADSGWRMVRGADALSSSLVGCRTGQAWPVTSPSGPSPALCSDRQLLPHMGEDGALASALNVHSHRTNARSACARAGHRAAMC